MTDKINLGSINSLNLFWNAIEAWKGLYQEGPFYDIPKTNETQTKQFSGMVALMRDAIDPDFGVDVVGPVELTFVPFDETNPEHNLCDTQMDITDYDRDYDDRVVRFWCDETNRWVLRSNPYWDAKATVQFNEWNERMNDLDIHPWSENNDWDANETYEVNLDHFIRDNC